MTFANQVALFSVLNRSSGVVVTRCKGLKNERTHSLVESGSGGELRYLSKY